MLPRRTNVVREGIVEIDAPGWNREERFRAAKRPRVNRPVDPLDRERRNRSDGLAIVHLLARINWASSDVIGSLPGSLSRPVIVERKRFYYCLVTIRYAADTSQDLYLNDFSANVKKSCDGTRRSTATRGSRR